MNAARAQDATVIESASRSALSKVHALFVSLLHGLVFKQTGVENSNGDAVNVAVMEIHSHLKTVTSSGKRLHCSTSSPSHRMLTSPAARPSSSDLGFFSSSKVSHTVASTSNTVVVTTRIARKPTPQQQLSPASSPRQPHASSSVSPASSPLSSPPPAKKRKTTPPDSGTAVHREVKRLRASATSTAKPRKRAQAALGKSSSRAPSRQQSLPPSPEPIYRTSRSRSTSTFPAADAETPIPSRIWITDESGEPGGSHLSSEMVVKRLIKSYKACRSSHRYNTFALVMRLPRPHRLQEPRRPQRL
jgi:hypothetical protein